MKDKTKEVIKEEAIKVGEIALDGLSKAFSWISSSVDTCNTKFKEKYVEKSEG